MKVALAELQIEGEDYSQIYSLLDKFKELADEAGMGLLLTSFQHRGEYKRNGKASGTEANIQSSS